MAYTKAEKERIIRSFKQEHRRKLEILRNQLRSNAEECEKKVLRRLNTVSVTLWNVKLKDVLEVERDHKPSVRNLLRDISQLHSRKIQEKYNLGPRSGIAVNDSAAQRSPNKAYRDAR